jgi:dTDP-4-dehydrorhamnose 3,5-epimerase
MKCLPTKINGLNKILCNLFSDQRGDFCKIYQKETFSELGLNTEWREQFFSRSNRGVVRGLHFQYPPHDHAKLVTCLDGEVLDVVVDLRRGSSTYGQHETILLKSTDNIVVYIPRGMAHGFLSLTHGSLVHYSTETIHSPLHDSGVHWASCGIDWQLSGDCITISDRDKGFASFQEFKSPF